MAEPTQSSMIDRLRGFVPDPVARVLDPVAPLREMLQRYTMGAPARPPEPPERLAPIENGTPVTVPITQPQQGPRRPSTPAVVTPTAAASPAPAQADQSQPSLLASLREAVAQDVAPLSSSERMGAFGRGVLSGRGSFLDNLSAGLAAQGQAEAARRNELRQSIETQARLAEMDRKAALEKAQFAETTSPESLTGRLRESQIRENLGRARFYEEGGRGGSGTQRGQITPQIVQDRLRRIPSEAAAMVARRYQNAVPPVSQDIIRRETAAEEQRLRTEYVDSLLAMGGAGAAIAESLRGAGQAAPQAAAPAAPTIDASGRPIR